MSEKRAVIYARYSSSRQREESIEGQIRECQTFAKAEGFQVIKIYADRAISGRTDARPEFQRMVCDAANKAFDSVLIYKFDRFARDRYAFAVYEMQLKKLGVKVYSVKEQVADGAAGVLLKSVLQGLAEYYSLDLAEKITRGMEENALKGRWSSGVIPFGYKRNAEKHLIFDEEKIRYRVKVFEMVDRNEKFIDIANYLNSHGIKNSRGRNFNAKSLMPMLQNPISIGTFRWRDIVIENYIEPIISKELFYRVQNKINTSERKGINVRKSDKYLLTPNIICAECQGPMTGMSGKSSTGELYYYYACANKRVGKSKCACTPLNRDDLETAIFNYACKLLSVPKNLDIIAEQAATVANSQKDEILVEMKTTRARLKKEMANYLAAIANGTTSGPIVGLVNKTDADLQELEVKIAERELLAPKPQIDKHAIKYFLNKIAKGNDEKSREQLLRTIVKDVIVEKQQPDAENKKDSKEKYLITVRFNFSDTPSLCSMQEFTGVRKNFNLVIHPRLERGTP